MKWVCIICILLAIPGAVVAFWGPGGMADGMGVGPGVAGWTDPYASDLVSLVTQQETNSTGITDSSGGGHNMRSIPDVATGPAMHVDAGAGYYVSRYDGADDCHILPTTGGGQPETLVPLTTNFTWAVSI